MSTDREIAMNKTTYYAAVEGFIEGKYRKAGDKVGELSEARAKYLLLACQITENAPSAPAAPAAPASKKDGA